MLRNKCNKLKNGNILIWANNHEFCMENVIYAYTYYIFRLIFDEENCDNSADMINSQVSYDMSFLFNFSIF